MLCTGNLFSLSVLRPVDSVRVELPDYFPLPPYLNASKSPVLPLPYSGGIAYHMFYITPIPAYYTSFESYLPLNGSMYSSPQTMLHPFSSTPSVQPGTLTDLYYAEGDYEYSRFSVRQQIYLKNHRTLHFNIHNFSDLSQRRYLSGSTRKDKFTNLTAQYSGHYKGKMAFRLEFSYLRQMIHWLNDPAWNINPKLNREMVFSRKFSLFLAYSRFFWESSFRNGIYQLEETFPSVLSLPGLYSDDPFIRNQHYDVIQNRVGFQTPESQITLSQLYFKYRKNVGFDEKDYQFLQIEAKKRWRGMLFRSSATGSMDRFYHAEAGLEWNTMSLNQKVEFKAKYHLLTYPDYKFPDLIPGNVPQARYVSFLFHGEKKLPGHWMVFSTVNAFSILQMEMISIDNRMETPKNSFPFTVEGGIHYQQRLALYGFVYTYLQDIYQQSWQSLRVTLQQPFIVLGKVPFTLKMELCYYPDLSDLYFSSATGRWYTFGNDRSIPLINFWLFLPVKSAIISIGVENLGRISFQGIDFDGYEGPQFRFSVIWRLVE